MPAHAQDEQPEPPAPEPAHGSSARFADAAEWRAPTADQVFNDDLVVESGQVLDGNVVVYSGDVTVKEGGTIAGNLIVYSGDVDVARGGTIRGDVTTFGGDMDVSGRVEGDLASASGDIVLENSAFVGGDVSVLSGDIERSAGATVNGSVVHGPNFRLLLPAGVPPVPSLFNPSAGIAPEVSRSASWGERLGWFLLSLVVAGVLTVIIALLAGLLTAVWPHYVERIEQTVRTQLPLSFAAGLLANLSLIFLSVFFTVLLCTAPLALVLVLGIVAINLAGWTALAAVVGKRITRYAGISVRAAATVAVGALALTAPLALVYAVGGCLRALALAATLLLGSTGAGAVALNLLRRLSDHRNNAPGATPTSPPPAAPPAPEPPPSIG